MCTGLGCLLRMYSPAHLGGCAALPWAHLRWAGLYIRRRQPKPVHMYTKLLLTPPRSHNLATANVETGSKLIEHRGGEALREDVGELGCRRDMEYSDLTDCDLLPDKVEVDLHMLGA